MKTKIAKILGIVLTITLLSSLAMVTAPVTAAPGVNAWGAVAGPPIVAPSSLGVLEVVESDGTIFASVYNGAVWSVWKSTDGGDTWKATSFNVAMGNPSYITDIVASPNYAVDGTIYVSTISGNIWRIKGEGADLPFLMAAPESEEGTTASAVFDLDLWFDGSFIWVMAATDLDVLVFQDAPLQYWRDQQLQITPIPTVAFEAAFAPDFNTSSRMWAVINRGGGFYVTSTVSTGQWDDSIAGVYPMNAGLGFVGATPVCELDFTSSYSAANPIVYLAASGPGTGNLWEIRGGNATPGTTQAIPLLLNDVDTTSVEVSGNVILVGTQNYFAGGVLRSLNLGNTFNPATKPPTGGSSFEVEMAPGAFSPTEGVAYCASASLESAFNISKDGGDTWNQTAWVDTVNTGTLDVAFSPVTASQPAFMITNGGPVDSLWRTDDITAATAVWTRVKVSSLTPTGLFQFFAVEYSMDGTTVMLYGMDLFGNLELWTSNDNGQTFNYWKTLQTESNEIADMIVVDNVTIFAAVNDSSIGNFGFLGTTLLGTDKERLPGVNGVSIALQPGFDASDADNSVVILGDDNNTIYISTDAGETWGPGQSVIAVGNGDVYVAFDADFANNGHIYFATSGSKVGEAALNGNKFASGSPTALMDDSDDSATATSFSGIRVSPDNALYALGGDAATTVPGTLVVAAGATIDIQDAATVVQVDEFSIAGYPITEVSGTWDDGETFIIVSDTLVVDPVFDNILVGRVYIQTAGGDNGYIDIDTVTATGLWAPAEDVIAVAGAGALVTDVPMVPASSASTNLFRLLLHEDDNMWETAASDGALGLDVTEGSNYVWTLIGNVIYGLQDTLSGPVQGVTVSSIGETKATVSWDAMVGSSLTYEYDVNPTGTTDKTTVTVSGLTDNKDYEARVRVATQMVDSFPWSSRWSSAVDFTTLEAIAVPVPRVPAQGLQNAPLLPSFVWDAVSNAVSYDFELSTDPSFATTLISTSLTITGYTYEGPELAYDTDHYWRVRARSATGTISAWTTIQNFHTRVEVIPPPDPIILPDPVTPVVTVNLPPPQVTVNIPDVIVESPDVIVDVPPVVTVTQPPQQTFVLPERDDPSTPVYIWVIVGIGAILTIAVIVLIIRTRRVV